MKKGEKKKKVRRKSRTAIEKSSEINKNLLNNFISLQKVMVNLAVKIDSLSTQMSKLLETFEISAKSLARKDFEGETGNKDPKKILEKLDILSQQAGLIGKGLALIHEINSDKNSEYTSSFTPKQQIPFPNPVIKKAEFIPPRKTPIKELEGYQKSITSEKNEQEKLLHIENQNSINI